MARANTTQPSSNTTIPTQALPDAWKRYLRELGLADMHAYRAWRQTYGFHGPLPTDWRQRRQERLQAERQKREASARDEQQRHYRRLGLSDEAAYADWCKRHAFSDALFKTDTQRERELAVAQAENAVRTLAAAKQFQRKPEETLQRVCYGGATEADLRKGELRRIASLSAAMGNGSREAFQRLMVLVRERTGLFSIDRALPHLGAGTANTFIDALAELARRYPQWLRSPEAWKPDSHNARRQFSALARHLLANYDVPAFMDAAWFDGGTERARRQQSWFLHIAGGQNIRTASVPVALTKKAAHLFLQAPSDFTIDAAFRWGQVHGLGGTERLTRAIVGSRLGVIQQDEPFWATVLQFFVNNPMLDPAQVGPLVDYIHFRRFARIRRVESDGTVRILIAEPDFSMKGRSPIALLRQMEGWHRQVNRENRRGITEWDRSGIEEFMLVRREGGGETLWAIRELRSSRELFAEGRAMHHCVATYVSTCARGDCSIWSLSVRTPQNAPDRVLTIEVNNARRVIAQIRGKCNRTIAQVTREPGLKHAADVLRAWAEQEGLTLSRFAL